MLEAGTSVQELSSTPESNCGTMKEYLSIVRHSSYQQPALAGLDLIGA